MPVSSASSSCGASSARAVQHVLELADETAQHGRFLLLEARVDHRALAPPTVHEGCSMVAHRPAAWSFATSTSTFSLLPDDTIALPLWCTSSISLVAWSRL